MLRRSLTLCLSSLTLASLPLVAGGQGQLASDTTVRMLDEAIVTATHTPRALKSLPVVTRVIKRADIERLNPSSVGDLLQMSLPGVELSQRGAQTNISLQGFSSDYVLFLIDGEPLTGEGNGVIDFARLDLGSIERIEAIQGSGGAVYGSNAIGGVINFITHKASQRWRGFYELHHGTEGLWRAQGSASGGIGKYITSNTSASVHKQRSYTIAETVSPEAGTMPESFTINASQRFSFGTEASRWRASLSGRIGHREQDYSQDVDYRYLTATIGGRASYTPNARNRFALSYNFDLYNRTSIFGRVFDSDLNVVGLNVHQPLFHLRTQTARLQYNRGADGDRLQFILGSEWIHERLESERLADPTEHYTASTLSLYGQADWRISDRLTLMAGLREDVHSSYNGQLSARLALMYAIGNCRLRATYSEGFRSPSLKQLHMHWEHLGLFEIVGNESLRPETSRTIALSPEYHSKRINLTVVGSYTSLHDQILFAPQTSTNGKLRQVYTNTGERAGLWNVQTLLGWSITQGLKLQASYSWIADQYKVDTDASERLPLSTVRPHNLTVSLTGHWALGKSWEVSSTLSARYSSSVRYAQTDVATGRTSAAKAPGYGILRLGNTVTYRGKLSLAFGIDNLFDYTPEDLFFTGSLSPGRTLFFTLRHRL